MSLQAYELISSSCARCSRRAGVPVPLASIADRKSPTLQRHRSSTQIRAEACEASISSISASATPRLHAAAQMQRGNRHTVLPLSLLCLACVACVCAGPAHASIGQALSTTLRDIAPDWVVIIALAAMPLIELRGAIPVGIVIFGIHPIFVFLLAALGNMLPVPLIMSALGPLLNTTEGMPRLHGAMQKVLDRAHRQAESWGSENVFWALAVFVGVPLPGTGAWSGAAVAFALGMPLAEGVLANAVGVAIAGTLVTVLSCMGWAGFWLAVTVLLLIPVVSFLWRSMSKDPKN